MQNKKALIILLAVSFMISLTVAAVDARGGCGCDIKSTGSPGPCVLNLGASTTTVASAALVNYNVHIMSVVIDNGS